MMNPELLPLAYNKSQVDDMASTEKHRPNTSILKNTVVGTKHINSAHANIIDTNAVRNGLPDDTGKPFYMDSELSSELNSLPYSSSSCSGSKLQLCINQTENRSHPILKSSPESDIVLKSSPSFSNIPSSPFMDDEFSNENTDNESCQFDDAQCISSFTSISIARSRNSEPEVQSVKKHVAKTLLRNSSSLSDQQPQKKRQRKSKFKGHRGWSCNTCEFALDREGKVYGIKLVHDAFPKGYSPRMYEDPTFFVVQNSKEINSRARDIILNSFDRDPRAEIYEDYRINLDGYNLQSLPDEINDFRDLVIYNKKGEISKPNLHLFASNNKLRSISPRLFDIGGLETLIIRDNKLARIPGAIGNAKDLRSLNVAQNKIKFFPHTILGLQQLQFIAIRPNPLIELDKDCFEIRKIDVEKCRKNAKFGLPDRFLRYVGYLHWTTRNTQISTATVVAMKLSRSNTETSGTVNTESEFWNPLTDESKLARDQEQKYACENASWCPKLAELVLRKVSQYLISQSEITKWKKTTNERVYKMAVKALIHGSNGEICGFCHKPVTEPVADIMEWWDFKDCSLLPIKRPFCSGKCAHSWWREIEPLMEEKSTMQTRKRKFYINNKSPRFA